MHCNTASPKSQENAVLIAIHPTTYRRGGFLAHGVLNPHYLTYFAKVEEGMFAVTSFGEDDFGKLVNYLFIM